jgi:predicted nucleic acid-binding protein
VVTCGATCIRQHPPLHTWRTEEDGTLGVEVVHEDYGAFDDAETVDLGSDGPETHDLAVDTLARLNQSSGFEVHQSAQNDFARAVELFGRYQGFGFGDAASVEREATEYLYSLDDDFDVLDEVTRLTTASDPFA